jgi:hypothetical protein
MTQRNASQDTRLVVREQALSYLEMARQDRRAAEEAFAAIPVEEQRELVLAAPPEQRISLLLLNPEPGELVRSVPEQELHRAVMAVGKWESQEVIEVASEDQINFMLDRDCWSGDRLTSRSFSDWLRLFMDCDDDQVFRLLTAINADLLAYALKKHVRFDRDIMVNDDYYCDPDWVHGTNATVTEFLQRLYALDPNLWVRLMGWVRTHSRGTIEADAIEARDSRLRGRGFPSYSLAITVYYPVDYDVSSLIGSWREAFAALPAQTAHMPVRPERDVLFLETVVERWMAHADPDDLFRIRLESELVSVANKVMIADQIDVADIRRQKEAVDKVRRWTNVALEFHARGEVEAACVALHGHDIEYFFRLGSMFFDSLATAVVDLEKERRSIRSRLADYEDMAPAYFALTQPEPHVPTPARESAGRVITSAAEYRYAWQLVWALEERFGLEASSA